MRQLAQSVGYLVRVLWHNFHRGLGWFVAALLIIGLVGSAGIPAQAAPAGCPAFPITSKFTLVYGSVQIASASAPVGTTVVARSPRDEVVGCFVTTSAGAYGVMYIYGEDDSVCPPLPGMRPGEQVTFSANGSLAQASPALAWQNDKDLHQVNLVTSGLPPPEANFTASPTAGLPPLSVQFSDLSTGNVTQWWWSFGDGGTSTQKNPSHSYTQVGVYSVSLTVYGPDGSDTLAKTDYISVFSGAPTADFSATPLSGIAPLTVNFTNLSTNHTLSIWSFGDDTYSDQLHPTHTYVQKGNYTVSLAVSGPAGSALKTRPGYITVYAPVQAAFEVDKTAGFPPLTVNFTNRSTGDFDTLLWDFGDGTTSGQENPNHAYQQAGVYSVELSLSGPGGSSSLRLENLITVYPWFAIYLPLLYR